MKHWLGRTPRTVGDWLGLALGTALIFGGVAQLPALAAALGRLAVILRPFLWGLVLAYVLDIPTRWLAASAMPASAAAPAVLEAALAAACAARPDHAVNSLCSRAVNCCKIASIVAVSAPKVACTQASRRRSVSS